jgi:hypothetical protein
VIITAGQAKAAAARQSIRRREQWLSELKISAQVLPEAGYNGAAWLSSNLRRFPEETLIGTIYKCEICRLETSSPIRWFVIHCSDSRLGIYKWDTSEADEPRALHFCGEAHAQVYISRWFESFCGSSVLSAGSGR